MRDLRFFLGRLAGTSVFMFRTQLAFRMAVILLVCLSAVTILAVRSSIAYARLDVIEQHTIDCQRGIS